MSVQPGKGGQKFLDTTFKKVEESKKIIDEMNYEIDIEIDGGIDNKVSKKLFNLGSKILVSGSYIIKNQKPFLIEVNTIPGLSKESIIPQQAQAAGLTLEKLFDMSIDHAIKNNK